MSAIDPSILEWAAALSDELGDAPTPDRTAERLAVQDQHAAAYARINQLVNVDALPAPYSVMAVAGNPQVRVELDDRVSLALWCSALGVGGPASWRGDDIAAGMIFARFEADHFAGLWARLACHEVRL